MHAGIPLVAMKSLLETGGLDMIRILLATLFGLVPAVGSIGFEAAKTRR